MKLPNYHDLFAFSIAASIFGSVLLLEWTMDLEKKINLVFAGSVAVATIVNVFIAKLQWSAMNENNSIARSSYANVQRAFVTVSSFEISQRYGSGSAKNTKHWWFIPVIKNSGNTPTKDLRFLVSASCPPELNIGLGTRVYLSCNFTEYPQPKDPEEDLKSPIIKKAGLNRALLGPQSSLPIGGIGITETSLAMIADGYPLFQRGIVFYKDTLSETEHMTKFCFQLGAFRSNATEIQATYSQCPHWNCTDDECKSDRADYEEDVAEGRIKPTPVVPPDAKTRQFDIPGSD